MAEQPRRKNTLGQNLVDLGLLAKSGGQRTLSQIVGLGANLQEFGTELATGRQNEATTLRDVARSLAADSDATRQQVSQQTRQAQADLLDPTASLAKGEFRLGKDPSLMGAAALFAENAPSAAGQFVAGAIGQRVGGVRAATALGAGLGAAQSAAAGGAEERQRAEALTPEQLANVEAYQQALAAGATPDEARQRAITQAERGGALGAGIFGAAGGAATARILGPAAQAAAQRIGGGRLGGAAVTGVAGGVEEGLQEVAEGVGRRAGAGLTAGEQRDVFEESTANLVGGAAVGAPLSAGIALATPPPPATVQPERGPISRAAARGIEAGAVLGATVAPLEMPAAAPVPGMSQLRQEPTQIEAAAPGFQSGDGAIAFDAPPSAPIPPAAKSNWQIGEAEVVQFPGLDPARREVEQRAWQQVIENPDAMVKAYRELRDAKGKSLTDGGRIVNTDEARELFPDYNAGPEARSLSAAAVHEPSSIIAKRVLAENLAAEPSGPDAFVLFTGGGTGAGKTTGIKRIPELAQRYDEADIIFDGNLQNADRAKTQIERAKASGRKAHIIYTFRDQVEAWQSGTLPRASREDYGRTVPANVQAATHIGAAKTALQLMNDYANDPDVKLDMVYNSFRIDDKDNAFVRPATIADVEAIASMDEAALTQELLNVLESEYQAGRIPEWVYRGTLPQQAAVDGRVQQPEQGLDVQGLPGRQAQADQWRLNNGPVGRAAGLVDDAARAAAAPVGMAGTGATGQPAAAGAAPAQGGGRAGVPAPAAVQPAVGVAAPQQGVVAGLPAAPVVSAPGGTGQQQEEVVRERQEQGSDAVSRPDARQVADGQGDEEGRSQEVTPDSRPQFLGAADGSSSTRRKRSTEAVEQAASVESSFAFASSQKFANNREFKLAIQSRVLSAAKAAKINLDEFSQEVEQYLTRMAVADGVTALRTNSNAVGWYNEKVTKALRLVSLVHPEIATDREARFAFTWALAVTSNGLKVDKNFELAEKVYQAYRSTGQMPVDIGIGTASEAINRSLGLFNTLIEKHGFEKVERFMTTLQPAGEVEKLTGNKVSGENKTTMVYGAAALGPKIGNGFFMNLYGRFEQLTMDRWLMRTWGRWTGTLVENNPAQVKSKRSQFKSLIGMLSQADKKAFESIIKRKMNVGELDAVALAIWKASQKPENRKKMAAIAVVDDVGKERFESILGKASKGVERFSVGDELRKSGNALTKYLDGQKEAPSGPPERGNIRKVFAAALNELQRQYPSLTMSDFQALLWYPEKRLYDSAKTSDEAVEAYEDDEAPDYANAAAKLARSKGVSDEQVRSTIESVDAELQADVGAGGVRRGERVPVEFVGAAAGDGGRRDQLRGTPARAGTPLPGAPRVKGAAGPDPRLVEVAEAYARANGITLRRQARYAEADPERGARIAAAYAEMEHAPGDPRVQAAYAELIRQTTAQYRALEAAGYRFWLMDPDNDPYEGNPWNAMRDLRATQSMAVFPTDAGFGSGATELDVSQNPLLADTGIRWPYGSPDGELRPVLANDLFRAVHDAFGHGLEGAGFRADGEENAWQAHVRLFTGDAIGAITSETRGQNSWLNFGPYGEQNRSAGVGDTVFADQKTGLMPEWTWFEGRVESEGGVDKRDQFKAPAPVRTSRIYAEMDGDEKKATQQALRALQRAGFPRSWIDRIPSFFTHNPTESFSARFYLYGEMKGAVSIRTDQFDDGDRMMRNLAHELAHAADYDQQVEGFYSESSPLFAVSERNGKMSFDGEIIKELHKAWESKSDIYYELKYPFDNDYDMDAKTMKVEAFAQMVMLYFTDRAALKKSAPKSYAFVERMISNEKQGEGSTKAGRGSAGQGDAAVQAALRVASAREFNSRSNANRDGARNQVEPEGRQDQAGSRWGEQRLGDGSVTETPEFKRWFGESKAVDDNGNPMIVYHGTPKAFVGDAFARGKQGEGRRASLGFHFGSSAAANERVQPAAEIALLGFGGMSPSIMPVYLKAERPLRMRDVGSWHRPADVRAALIEAGIDAKGATLAALQREIQAAGYDSIVYQNAVEDAGSDSWIVFEPTQVKSATGNSGAFDPREQSFLGRAAPSPSQAFNGFTLPSWELGQHLTGQAGARMAEYRSAAAAGGDKLRTVLQDYFLPIRRVQEAIQRTGNEITEDQDVYTREELYYGRTGEQLRQLEEDHVKPLVKAMVDAKIEQADLELYLYAKFAPQRNARIASINPKMPDGGSGMTNADAAQILADFDAAGMTPRLQRLAKRVRDMNDIRLRVLEEGGLLSAEEAELWRSEPDYVPLKGFADAKDDGQEPTVLRTGGGFSIGGREAHRALGRRTRAADLLANTVAQVEQAIIRAEKNRVAQALYRLVKANPNDAMWELDATEIKPAFDKATGEVVYRRAPEPNAAMVKVDGREHRIVLRDPRLIEAMRNMGAAKTGAFLRSFASINRFLSLTRTMLAPEFVLANFARDIQTAAVNLSGEQSAAMAAKVVKNVPQAVRALLRHNFGGAGGGRWQMLAKQLAEDGGFTSFVGQQAVEEQQDRIVDLLDEAKGGTKAAIKKLVRGTFDAIQNVNGAVENATRLAAYSAALDAGMSRQKAASIAKNLTVNFNRKGQVGPVMNSLYLFYNASIQGTQRFLRAMRTPVVQGIMASTAVLGYTLAMWNRAMAGEDDDGEDKWDKIPDWEKSRNLIILKPDGGIIKIPLPYSYNLPFVIGQQMEAMTNGRKSPLQGSLAVAETILTSFSPVGDIDLQGDSAIAATKLAAPTAIDPFVDIAVNRNFFGGPINPERSPFDKVKDPDSAMAFPATNPGAVWLAKALNRMTGGDDLRSGLVDVSPGSMVYVFDYLTGGTGGFVERTATAATLALSGKDVPVAKVPFVRVFAGELSDRRATDTFYRVRDDVNLKIEMGKVKGLVDPEDRRDIAIGRRLAPLLRTTERQLKTLRDRRKIAQAAGRDALVEQIKLREIALQTAFNRRYFALVYRTPE